MLRWHGVIDLGKFQSLAEFSSKETLSMLVDIMEIKENEEMRAKQTIPQLKLTNSCKFLIDSESSGSGSKV